MGIGSKPNILARALCTSLVVALLLGGLALLLASMTASCCICWTMCCVLGDGGDNMDK